MGSRKGFTLIELLVVVVIGFIVIAGVIGIAGAGCSSMFSKRVYSGVVEECVSLTPQIAGGPVSYSFSLRIRTPEGIEVSSSEDRQFATVRLGDSVRVATFKYAPWEFDKQGTYHGTRLLKVYGSTLPAPAPVPVPAEQ